MLFVFVFFFKQKTAYEMRISDWSSDVCSSDLLVQGQVFRHRVDAFEHVLLQAAGFAAFDQQGDSFQADGALEVVLLVDEIGRASCGKECVSTCRSRWSPYH